MNLEQPTAGEIRYKGEDITKLSGRALKAVRRNIQMVFQDPYTSLNPRMTVGDIIGEPFEIHPEVAPKGDRRQQGPGPAGRRRASTRSTSTATRTSSPAASASASASPAASRCDPEIIVCDEPVSALDVSVQAQVINLLEQLQDEFDLSYVFIAHDLSDRPAHLRPGRRDVPRQDRRDRHRRRRSTTTPPTRTPRRCCPPCRCPTRRPASTASGSSSPATCPRPANPPSGCRFRTRCWKAQERCALEVPPLAVPARSSGDRTAPAAHDSACHFAEEKAGRAAASTAVARAGTGPVGPPDAVPMPGTAAGRPVGEAGSGLRAGRPTPVGSVCRRSRARARQPPPPIAGQRRVEDDVLVRGPRSSAPRGSGRPSGGRPGSR